MKLEAKSNFRALLSKTQFQNGCDMLLTLENNVSIWKKVGFAGLVLVME